MLLLLETVYASLWLIQSCHQQNCRILLQAIVGHVYVWLDELFGGNVREEVLNRMCVMLAIVVTIT